MSVSRRVDRAEPLSPHDLRDDVHLAFGRDRLEPGVLKDLAIDRDRDAVLEVRLQAIDRAANGSGNGKG